MKETIRNLKKVYEYGKEYKKCLIYETIGSAFGIAIGILLPILAAKQIVYLTNNKWEQLIYMSVVILIVGFIGAIKTVLIRKNTQKFTVGITEKMQKQLGREILKITQTDLDNNSTGTFVQRMTSDTDELATMFTTGYGRLIGLISSLGTFIAIFVINKIVFLYYVLVAIILTRLHLSKAKEVNRKDKEKRLKQERVSGLTTELVRGTRDVKMLNAKDSFIKVLNENIKEKNSLYLSMRNVDISYNFFIDVLSELFEFILIIIFIYLIKDNVLTVAMAIALYSYRNKVMSDFKSSVSSLLEEAHKFNLSFNRVFSILDNKEFKKEKFGKNKIENIKGDFEFKDVEFSYDNDVKVLDKLNFKVKANTTVGFVGKSGAGKTTIFSLLCKMYDIDSGKITIDGKDINDLDEDSIRGNITIIGQSPYIFNMSIVDNMKLVKENVTLDEIKEACKLACLDDYIESLPNKYDTVVGEGGVTLSGGQKQRLAIARALIQKTEIILFDEATSALDNETQSKIQDAINNLKRDYTILIIAHRFSTILNCDEIFYMESGKIIASGSHKELIKKCKEYKKLYETELEK
ncbi:MAG: ABC transporter ATP-binding protein [Firmicutes bacterium]|nr:ABC transporter ATP-binding protein [Bacillota bacterium]